MVTIQSPKELLTPDQAAELLQVNRETIYRYIRDGRLSASKLGRTYRIPRRNLELLLWATRTRPDIPLREYTDEELEEFFEEDELSGEALEIARRFRQMMDSVGSVNEN